MGIKCKSFKAFEKDPEVCDNCGELSGQHPGPGPVTPFRKDMWAVLLREGGVSSFYGGYDTKETLEIRAHLGLPGAAESAAEWNARTMSSYSRIEISETPCSIDWRQTGDPVMDWVGEFEGTDCEAARIDAVTGCLYCACGELFNQDWCLKNKTLGQLVWLVSKEVPASE